MAWNHTARSEQSRSARWTDVVQNVVGAVGKFTFRIALSAAEKVSSRLGAAAGSGVGLTVAEAADRSGHHVPTVVAVGVGAIVGEVIGDRAGRSASQKIETTAGPAVAGPDKDKLQTALAHAGRMADKTADQATRLLTLVDRIEATIREAGSRNPPRSVKQALLQLAEARKMLAKAEELGISASSDVDAVLTELITS